MRTGTLLCAAIIIGSAAGTAHAAITANNSITVGTLSPNAVSNDWTVDTDSDFISASVLVELTTGTLHNPNSFAPGVETFFNAFPGDKDTFLSANGNPSIGIAGGGPGELAGCLAIGCPSSTPVEFGPTVLRVAWFSPGADTDDIGTGLPIGSFAFTDDAAGTWQLLVINAADDQELLTGVVINGAMVPEPATLSLLGLGGLALLLSHRKAEL